MKLSTVPLALLAVVATTVHAASLTLRSPRLQIIGADGVQLRSEPLSLVHKPAIPPNMTQSDTLKINFQILDKDSGNGVQPHQAFLRFFDPLTLEEGIQPLRVSASGKVKYELSLAKPPPSLPPTTGAPLKVLLILGSASHSPLKAELFDLYIPASQSTAPHPDEASYHSLPVIEHTFREEPKLPPQAISAAFSLAVLSPWIVLVGMWGTISPKLPRAFSPRILPFTATLGAFEMLLVWYWVDLRLGDVLLYGGILGTVTIFTGRSALASIADRRLGVSSRK